MVRTTIALLLAVLSVLLPPALLAHAGSVYVPLDSWTYPALERLAVLTNTESQALGMRPWTRLQVAHFVELAREMNHDVEAMRLQYALEREFAAELNSQVERSTLEQVYTRSTEIAGTPIRDSYHFGQTLANDFGRPFGRGLNDVTGESGYGQYRAGFIYVRGEYQHSAAIFRPSAAAIQAMGVRDWVTPAEVLTQGAARQDAFRLLDSYVGVSMGRFQASLGKQSLWWGPGRGGAMTYSNNIEPIWMGRLTNDTAYNVPLLGKFHLDMFYGKLQSHRYLKQPWIHGEKFTLRPLKDLEFGFTRTVVFLGDGRGATLGRIWHSYINIDDGAAGNSNADTAANDPGDRRSAFEVSYKLPRVPATFYLDSFADDDPLPLAQPKRSSFHPGMYVARLPGGLSQFDLRMEGSFSTVHDHTLFDGFNYWNSSYRDGYTNKAQLIGDVVGRAGVSWQLWSTWWHSPREKVEMSFRNQYVSGQFMPGGGTQNTFRVVGNYQWHNQYDLEVGLQPQRLRMPLLLGTPEARYNFSGWFGVRYTPEWKLPPRP